MESIHRIEFHSILFHAGKNFGNKVEVHKVPNLEITYDNDKRLFFVDYFVDGKHRKAVLPETSAFMWEPAPKPSDGGIPVIENKHKTSDVRKFKSAQVSSPMGHVFEGPGAGKTK